MQSSTVIASAFAPATVSLGVRRQHAVQHRLQIANALAMARAVKMQEEDYVNSSA